MVHAVILSHYSISSSLLKEQKQLGAGDVRLKGRGESKRTNIKGNFQQKNSEDIHVYASTYSIGKLGTVQPQLGLGTKMQRKINLP